MGIHLQNHPRRAAAVIACCLMIGLLPACTSTPQPVTFRPSLVWGPCPEDVETTFLSPHQCGTLTVLANRAKPKGATITLLVGKVPPPAGARTPGTGTSFGANFGDAETISGSIATGTSRTGITSLQLEWRGSGPHSTPSLRCPEVDPLGARAAAVPHDNADLRNAFVAAVAACAKRLRSHGIDPADYDTAAMAQDIEDLRVAAGIDRWQLAGTYGTQSAVLFEYLRRYPGRVEAAYLDSPAFTSPAGFQGGAAALQQTLDALFRTCRQTPACRAEYPDLQGLWSQALDGAATHPLRGTTDIGDQHVTVLVDAPKLLRATRLALGAEGGPLTALPRIISDAAHGRLAPELAQTVASDPIFCSGYRPQCRDPRFSLGLFLTSYCRAPAMNREEATDATRGASSNPAYESVFKDAPYTAACAAWDTPPESTTPTSHGTGVPLLLMSGSLDSFSPPATTLTAAHEMGSQTSVLEVPGGIHNVLGFYDCAITARNNWSRNPTQPAPTDACAKAPGITFR
jgi:pimeloyl-ACP methyl ester carboxylesterase